MWKIVRIALADLKKQYERDIAKMERNFRYKPFNRKWNADRLRMGLRKVEAMIALMERGEYAEEFRAPAAVSTSPEEKVK